MSSTVQNNKSTASDLTNRAVSKANRVFGRVAQTVGGENHQLASKFLLTLLLSSLATLLLLSLILWSGSRETRLARSLGDLKLLSQQISRQSNDAATLGDKSVGELRRSKQQFEQSLQTVNNLHGNDEELEKLNKQWVIASKNIDLIVARQKTIATLQTLGTQVNETVPGIQSEYNLLADGMTRANYPAVQVALAKNQVYLAERILRSINAVMSSRDNSVEYADNFSADAETFGAYLDGALKGNTELGVQRIDDPNLRAILNNIKKEYDQSLKVVASNVLINSAPLLEVREAGRNLSTQSNDMLSNLNKLSESATSLKWLWWLLLPFAIIPALYSIYRLIQLRAGQDRARVIEMKSDYERNQNAILRLLDEIGDLADGDLRSYATVSEDFTGAIADSINFAIDQLRELVSRINTTSEEVARYSQETQHITMQLSEASEHNAQEIAGASAAISQMAESIDQVSANATQSAEVAQRSVNIAANGAAVVNRTIHGMDTIREQIQETSKRIKRLGESSQEIGNIVSLINDIADQTNILALNAAIQASMAGEAGRGFAVVADEVQRLAERSTAATKQIETLVKTIQSDTNEAVSSMELTTTEVVRGTTLAKDAGVALGEIQSVSNNLASLIQNISDAAREQASTAAQISHTMNTVQDVTHQTTASTMDAARSVNELAHMADTLRESVTDFKLPEEMI